MKDFIEWVNRCPVVHIRKELETFGINLLKDWEYKNLKVGDVVKIKPSAVSVFEEPYKSFKEVTIIAMDFEQGEFYIAEDDGECYYCFDEIMLDK